MHPFDEGRKPRYFESPCRFSGMTHPFDKAVAEGREAAAKREQQTRCAHSFHHVERLLLWRCIWCGATMTDQQVYVERERSRSRPR